MEIPSSESPHTRQASKPYCHGSKNSITILGVPLTQWKLAETRNTAYIIPSLIY